MRLEKITTKALANVKNDRYLLSLIVAKRAGELSEGAEPRVEVGKTKTKFADIALMEIAEGKVEFKEFADKEQ